MLRCPHCNEVLSRSRVGAIELDGCRACGGMFFDAGELSTLAKEPARLLEVEKAFVPTQPAIAPKETHVCPKCRVPMVPREETSLQGIPFDACKQCKGIWLNSGQARAIAQRRGVAVPAPHSAPEVRTLPTVTSVSESRHPNRALAIAVVTMIAVLFTSTRSVRALSGERAQGTVVRVDRVDRGFGGYSRNGGYRSSSDWRAVVQFQADDRTVTIEETVSFFDILLTSGDSVTVLYPASDPQSGRIGTFSGLWFVPLLLLIVGSIITVGAYLGKANVVFQRLPNGWDW